MKSFRNNPIVLAGMAALLLVLLIGLLLILRMLSTDCAQDGGTIGREDAFATPGPTLLDLHATYDRTEAVQIRVYDHRADRIITMDLEEYIVGVVAA